MPAKRAGRARHQPRSRRGAGEFHRRRPRRDSPRFQRRRPVRRGQAADGRDASARALPDGLSGGILGVRLLRISGAGPGVELSDGLQLLFSAGVSGRQSRVPGLRQLRRRLRRAGTRAAPHAGARAARRHGRTCRFARFRPDDRYQPRAGRVLRLARGPAARTQDQDRRDRQPADGRSPRTDAGVVDAVAAARLL